jgi:hypothetical protein
MMGRLWSSVGPLRAALALTLLAAVVAAPTAALADRDGGHGNGPSVQREHDDDDFGGGGRKNDLTCPGKHTLVRIDEKICEPTPDRPLIIRKRVCCQNPAGKVHCDHFEHCPRVSPS